MMRVNEEEVKRVLKAVNEALSILEDDLSGDLQWITDKINKVIGILSDIPMNIEEISEEVKDDE